MRRLISHSFSASITVNFGTRRKGPRHASRCAEILLAVDETAYHKTPAATAFSNYLAFSFRTSGFYDVGQRGLKLLALFTPFSSHPAMAKIFGAHQWTQALAVHHMGKREIDDDFGFFSALVLVASWAAFEAYVDDACTAMLHMDPTLLTQGNLARVRLSQDEQQLDQAAQLGAYLRRGSYLCPGSPTPVEKIEWQLGLVGLNGTVPAELAVNVNASKHTRNAWAHKAGKADQYFVTNCPGTTFNVGDIVTVTRESFLEDLYGITSYAFAIINRFRDANGMRPYQVFGSTVAPNPFKAAVEALFPNPISWDELRNMT